MPNFSNPLICKSMGLVPISQPPGYENDAFLYLPIILQMISFHSLDVPVFQILLYFLNLL